MSTKIKLGARPKNFKHIVTFPLIEGGTGKIEVLYKYRTRTEFGVFIDKMVEAAGEKNAQVEDEKFSMTKLMEKTAGQNADYVLDVLDGWNLEVELTRANVEQLADEYPAAVSLIMEDYRKAILEGRLGN